MKIGFLQFRPRFGDIQHNLHEINDLLDTAKADLIVAPELALTGYYFQNREEALALAEEPQESAAIESLIGLCRRKNFRLIIGFAEREQDKCFNSALLLGPAGLEHTYRKIHLFNEEKLWFDPGDTPLQLVPVGEARVGMMICFDWVFPETARTLAVLGADIICHPSNLVLTFCQRTMISRCLENGVFAVTANRFGTDERPQGELSFTGHSQIVDPKGNILAAAAAEERTVKVVEIDPTLARNKQFTPLNDLMKDRRPEFYTPLVAQKRN